jgi:glycerol-3-phosphate cytidylyltransferase-like family protein
VHHNVTLVLQVNGVQEVNINPMVTAKQVTIVAQEERMQLMKNVQLVSIVIKEAQFQQLVQRVLSLTLEPIQPINVVNVPKDITAQKVLKSKLHAQEEVIVQRILLYHFIVLVEPIMIRPKLMN